MEPIRITWRAARVNRRFTLREVAKYTGKSVDTISRYEFDSSEIPRDLMMELSELYDVDTDNIFFGKESDFIGSHRKKIILRQTAN